MTQTDNFINSHNKSLIENQLKNCIIFTQTLGIIMITLSLFDYLEARSLTQSNICLIFTAIGISLLSLGLIYPYIMMPIYKMIKYITNKIFNLILYIILTIVYLIFVLPIGLFIRKKYAQKYKYVQWNDDCPIEESTFKVKEQIFLEKDSNKKPMKIRIIKKIISYFFYSKQYMLLPIIFILLLLGILMFFLTSSIVTPMIYPLF